MSRGGSRFGAGRPGYKSKAENCLRLDVRALARDSVLSRAAGSSVRWSRASEEIGSIGVYPQGRSSVRLGFSCDGQPCAQSIPLRYTPCNIGGERPWFACPVCTRRCAVLYLKASRFACRKCQRVAYASQSEDACGRAWRGQQKVEGKLGPDWARPKGMHSRTRERLLERIWHFESVRDDAITAFAIRHFGSVRQLGRLARA